MHRYNTRLYCNLMLYSNTLTISIISSMLRCYTAIGLVMVGLVYKAYPDGCRHMLMYIYNPAKSKALPGEGAFVMLPLQHATFVVPFTVKISAAAGY